MHNIPTIIDHYIIHAGILQYSVKVEMPNNSEALITEVV